MLVLALAVIFGGLLVFYVNKRLSDTNISEEDIKNAEKLDNLDSL